MPETNLYNKIKTLQSLWPSDDVDFTMSALTEYCCNNSHQNTQLTPLEINFIRMQSSVAETNLEMFWATKLLKKTAGYIKLEDFIYYSNYNDLINLELTNTLIYNKNIKNILFIGGGPLPLTAILLAYNLKYNVTILEKDKVSYNLSKNLIDKLELNKKIKVILISAEEYNQYNQYDLIYIAAMVGNTQEEKDTILNNISEKVKLNTMILIRSAFAVKELLYFPFTFKHTLNLKLLTEVRPYNHIVNSFFVLQKI